MNKDNLEIERKFLLKNVPKFNLKKITKLIIHQIYVDVDGRSVRFRMTENMNAENRVYHQCEKSVISHGVFEEIENEVSSDVFNQMLHKDHRYIIKTRYVYEEGGLKWEVDKYHDVRLVTLEVELNEINQEITIPEIIKEQMIVEVTGQKVFSNFSLSIKEGSIS
jgi:CYTH domain-containing protein